MPLHSRKQLGFLAVLLFSAVASTQTVVASGNLEDLGQNYASPSDACVQFKLGNYMADAPRTNGKVLTSASAVNFYGTSSRAFSGALIGYDQTTPTNTFSTVCVFYVGSSAFTCGNDDICVPVHRGTCSRTGATRNLNGAQPMN